MTGGKRGGAKAVAHHKDRTNNTVLLVKLEDLHITPMQSSRWQKLAKTITNKASVMLSRATRAFATPEASNSVSLAKRAVATMFVDHVSRDLTTARHDDGSGLLNCIPEPFEVELRGLIS